MSEEANRKSQPDESPSAGAKPRAIIGHIVTCDACEWRDEGLADGYEGGYPLLSMASESAQGHERWHAAQEV